MRHISNYITYDTNAFSLYSISIDLYATFPSRSDFNLHDHVLAQNYISPSYRYDYSENIVVNRTLDVICIVVA